MKTTMQKTPEGYSLLLEYPTQYLYTEFYAYKLDNGWWALKVLHYNDSIRHGRQHAVNNSHAHYFAKTIKAVKAHVKTCVESIDRQFEDG